MVKLNSAMIRFFLDYCSDSTELARNLIEIGECGFEFKDGCFFLRKLLEFDTNASIENFPDKTGYECFINSLHIDDYVESDFLGQAVSFIKYIFSKWNESQGGLDLVAILSSDGFGVNVRFHVRRPGEQWLTDEVEDYKEPILILDSSEKL